MSKLIINVSLDADLPFSLMVTSTDRDEGYMVFPTDGGNVLSLDEGIEWVIKGTGRVQRTLVIPAENTSDHILDTFIHSLFIEE